MSQNIKNWDKARIAARIELDNPAGGVIAEVIQLPNRVSIKATFNYEPLHGLNEWNQGIIEKAPEFTFVIAVPAVSATSRLLRTLQVSGVPFKLFVNDQSDSGEFELRQEVLSEARLTSKEMTVVVEDVPMIVYNGMALRYTYTDDGTMDSSIEFGSGEPMSTDIFQEWGN